MPCRGSTAVYCDNDAAVLQYTSEAHVIHSQVTIRN